MYELNGTNNDKYILDSGEIALPLDIYGEGNLKALKDCSLDVMQHAKVGTFFLTYTPNPEKKFALKQYLGLEVKKDLQKGLSKTFIPFEINYGLDSVKGLKDIDFSELDKAQPGEIWVLYYTPNPKHLFGFLKLVTRQRNFARANVPLENSFVRPEITFGTDTLKGLKDVDFSALNVAEEYETFLFGYSPNDQKRFSFFKLK
jgi:hypothetical protein